jgi:hypothetical protein
MNIKIEEAYKLAKQLAKSLRSAPAMRSPPARKSQAFLIL